MANRDAKLFRLGQLVEEYNDYGYTRLNRILKEEFGSGLARDTISEVIRSVRPTRRTLGLQPEETFTGRYRILLENGFYPFEAKKLSRMDDIKAENRVSTFTSPVWQKAMSAHRDYIRQLINKRADTLRSAVSARGLKYPAERILAQAKRDVGRSLSVAMRRGKYSIYDWLKEEYPKVKPTPTKYQVKSRKIAADKLNTIGNEIVKQRVMFWE